MKKSEENSNSGKIASVTMLRGIACLAVCFMHFSYTLDSEILMSIAEYGGYGVPLFFAISGFIIPYSMDKAGYRVSDYFKFFAKRIIRIEPAYVMSIVAILLLSALAQFSSFSASEQIPIDTNTLYHLFYLVEFMDGEWLNPVYWTLAIEFQFYIIIGLLFPILASRNLTLLIIVFVCFCGLPALLFESSIILKYLAMFLPGVIMYWYKSERITLNLFIILGIVLGVVGYYLYGVKGPICALFFTLFILFVSKPWKPLIFIGMISYSLYLIHTIVGTDGIINFMQNYILDPNDRVWLTIATFPVVVLLAWIFYLIIERPSIKISKRINY